MMDYFCEICDKHFISKIETKHFNSASHIEKSKSDHIIVSLRDPNFDELYEI